MRDYTVSLVRYHFGGGHPRLQSKTVRFKADPLWAYNHALELCRSGGWDISTFWYA